MKKFLGYIFLGLWSLGCTYYLVKVVNAADKKIDAKEAEMRKYKLYYNLCSCWVGAKQRGRSIAEYLEHENMNIIAVYGMGDIGIRFCKELQGTKINIKYVMDQNMTLDTTFAPRIKLDEELPKVDAIIVTPINSFSQIRDILAAKTDCAIVSIEDIIFGL